MEKINETQEENISLYQCPQINNSNRFSDDIKSKIILGSLAGSVSESQTIIPGLEKFTKLELRQEFLRIMKNGPHFDLNTSIPENFLVFSQEEDLALIIYDRLYSSISLDTYIQNEPSFKPFRTYKSIEQRLLEIRRMNKEEKTKIINNISYQIALEKFNYEMSKAKLDCSNILHDTTQCLYSPHTFPSQISITQEVNDEINSLNRQLPLLKPQFSHGELAIFRSEGFSYSMLNQTIIIGRGTSDHLVDINLEYENDGQCSHISRYQAVVSFRDDLKFYLENCGSSLMRVNGVIIPPKGLCMLHDNDLLDFNGILLLFLINDKLVYSIQRELIDDND